MAQLLSQKHNKAVKSCAPNIVGERVPQVLVRVIWHRHSHVNASRQQSLVHPVNGNGKVLLVWMM